MTFEPDEPVSIVGQPLFRVVADEVFILMPDSKVHWLRNATAKVLWDRLIASGQGGVTASAMAARITEEFDVEGEMALPDVLAFVQALADRGLVARSAAATAGDDQSPRKGAD